MAGGTWLSQNKVRPGAYLNFESVPKSTMTVGDRGVVAVPLALNWGARGQVIEVLSSDLLDGNSKKKIGFTAFDDESKLLRGVLSYAYKALVFNTYTGGAKATVTEESLTVTAKYEGTFGNKIIVSISEDGSLYKVVTYVDGSSVDTQKVSDISELEPNDYVVFSGSGNPPVNSGIPLANGENGTSEESTFYPEFFSALKVAKWQTMCCFSSNSGIKGNVATFIEGMRNDEGRYVQAVVADYEGVDFEGIINSISGAVIDDVTYSKEDFVAIVAGITAGANFNESNTGKVIKGATSIVNELDDTQIKEALANGKFLISTSSSGKIKVEQDINSYHTFTKKKDKSFSKNRVIRTLDEIGTTTKLTWEETYMGKVDNDATGRGIFKDDLTTYGNELQRLRGIQNFNGPADIEVLPGTDIDAVVCNWSVQPVDSMEKLYMTVRI